MKLTKVFLWAALVAFIVVDLMLLGLFPGKRIPVLMYHHVVEKASNKLEVSKDRFAMQMKYLVVNDHDILTADRLKVAIAKKQWPKKKVAVTFDDGYADNYEFALPILEENGIKATFFIVPDWVGTPGYMSWDQIRDLEKRGHTIGSHSLSHPFLTEISPAQARTEIVQSKRILRENLRQPVRYFCYPVGRFNEEIQGLVKDAGYEGAFATAPGWAYSSRDPFAIKRIKVSDSSDRPFKFWWRVSGYYLLVRERTAKRMKG